MKPLLALVVASSLGLSSAPFAEPLHTAPDTRSSKLHAHRSMEGETLRLGVRVEGAAGSAFLWLARVDDELRADDARVGADDPRWQSLGVFPLDADGDGDAAVELAPALLPAGSLVSFQAVYLDQGVVTRTPVATLDPDEEPTGETLDLDWGVGGIAQPTGAIVSDTQPWSRFMTLSAEHADASGPDAAILFDSGAPTPGYEDLRTPGSGAGNFRALGQLLIVADDLVDSDGDGLVDAPRPAAAGGTLVLDFPERSTIGCLELVDVDEEGGEARFYDESGLLYSMPIPAGEDNGVQRIFGGFGLTRVEIELAGTAGIGELVIYPCFAALDFDHSSTGVPLGLPAGMQLAPFGNEYGGLGVYFLAENAHSDHPDVGVLFDTAAPTGEDPDLATPGYGQGNDEALGNVLVIAEDDIDLDGDDLVDDPDDERAGGVLGLAYYTSDAYFRSATVLDVDVDETAWIEVHLNSGDVEVVPLESLGDNSSQTVTGRIGPTRYIELHCSSSAALAELVVSPAY